MPGQYYDQESGLHYNYFRDYDPKTGRYPEADPAGVLNGMNHLYVYAQNNPVALVDLFGYAPGNLFLTAEAAAIDAIDFSRPLTDSGNIEYCGLIIKAGCQCQELYYYKYPSTSGVSCECASLGWPSNGSANNFYHTHTQAKDSPWWAWRYSEKFSPEDAEVCFK